MKHRNLLGVLLPLLPVALGASCAEQLLKPQVQLIDMTTASYFAPEAISRDGSRVVGIPGDRIWVNGVFVPLAPPHGSFPRGVSDDGGVIVGMGVDGGTLRWDHGVITWLEAVDASADIHDLSADGSVAVGWDFDGNVVWHGDQPAPLESLDGFVAERGTGVSADGEIIVGFGSFPDRGRRPFVWELGEATEIVGPPGASDDAEGSLVHVSGDGSTVVHHDIVGTDYRAFRWRDGAAELLLLPDGSPPTGEATASAVSGNGEVIAGTLVTANGGRAAIWDSAHGLRELQPLLVALGAPIPPGVVLTSVTGMSDDGRRLIGIARKLHPFDTTFIVTLPPACADHLDNDGDGLTDWPEDSNCGLRLDLSESE